MKKSINRRDLIFGGASLAALGGALRDNGDRATTLAASEYP
jgi:hypothetical protein